MITPIWRDTLFNIPASASPYSYTIEKDGVSVFQGKAWVAPAATAITVNINRIAQDYLAVSFPDLDAVSAATALTITHDDAVGVFTVSHENNTVSSFTFYNCWDYESQPLNSASNLDLSKAINRHGTYGMYYFKTVLNSNGTTGSVVTTASTVPVDGYSEDYCGDYALYYLSRSCGWSSYLIEGSVKRVDEYNRYSITKDYDNTTINRGKTVYNNQINPRWEVHTGWVNNHDSEAIAFQLLSSNQVYLHDLKNDRVYPVVITDASAEYKNRNNQQNRIANYTINVSAAQIQQNLG